MCRALILLSDSLGSTVQLPAVVRYSIEFRMPNCRRVTSYDMLSPDHLRTEQAADTFVEERVDYRESEDGNEVKRPFSPGIERSSDSF